jgi:hypothetical protein
MMLSQALGLTERAGGGRLSLLRGTEPYKMRWHPATVRNRRLLLANPGRRALPVGYAAAVRARTALADATRDRLPWLRRVRFLARQAAARVARTARSRR